MSGAGSALMGIGSSRGEGRAVQAAGKAINSPLLEASMDGAQGVLLSIAGGSDLGLFEINEAASLVQEAAHPEANIIFGTVIDDSLGDEVRVTVIAAGFEAGGPTHKKLEPHGVRLPDAGVRRDRAGRERLHRRRPRPRRRGRAGTATAPRRRGGTGHGTPPPAAATARATARGSARRRAPAPRRRSRAAAGAQAAEPAGPPAPAAPSHGRRRCRRHAAARAPQPPAAYTPPAPRRPEHARRRRPAPTPQRAALGRARRRHATRTPVDAGPTSTTTWTCRRS